MDKVRDPNVHIWLTLGNTVGLLGSVGYLYKMVTDLKADVESIKKSMTTLSGALNNNNKYSSDMKTEIIDINKKVGLLEKSLDKASSSQVYETLQSDFEGLLDALRDQHKLEITLPSEEEPKRKTKPGRSTRSAKRKPSKAKTKPKRVPEPESSESENGSDSDDLDDLAKDI